MLREYKMNFKKIFVLSLVSTLAISVTPNVYASDSEVIYKIHDVMPVRSDGEVTSCDFSVTFFNRTSQIVSNLSLDISWLDDVIEDKIKDEKKEQIKDDSGRVSGYSGQSKTEQFTSKMISTNLSVPPLPPIKQISLKASVKTDRCFLLLEKPQMKINSCKLGAAANVDKAAGSCNDLFVFISSESGDYFSEFKPISYDEEKKEAEQQNQNEQKELDSLYNNAISSVKRVSQTLDSMK